ncbi:Peptidoglycan synthase FtsI precursor [Rickettsiales bacterium Ac37b]|nr:Peptidoglycan synthase FtsI precursor [Rickettsiales bacterium Ac37b]
MNKDESNKAKLFSRRSFIMGIGGAGLFSLLAGRLYYLQVIKNDQYKTLSESNRIKFFLIPALRGNILDSFGVPIAVNKNHYRVILDKEYGVDYISIVQKISDILKIDRSGYEQLLKKIKQARNNTPILLQNLLTWEEVVKLEVHAIELPNVYVDVGTVRFYNYKSLFAHLVGYTGAPSEKEVAVNALLNHPDIKVGKTGIELTMNSELSGELGVKRMEVNAYGVRIRELSREESKSGQDINLTIDVRLQEIVASKLDSKGAIAVLMDINTGGILAMASTPSFDPNHFTQGLSSNYWDGLINDPYFPLINKAISVQYPPGSIFKLVVALAALEEGISSEMFVNCPGYTMLGERKFHCWKDGGHGDVNMLSAIAGSCNCYFWAIARRIGIEKISQMAYKLGLGTKTGIELPNEFVGIIPNRKWKKKKYKKDWQLGDTLNSAVGQGFVSTTILQLAVMVARIASGKEVRPYLINNINNQEVIPNSFGNLDIDPKNLTIVRKGMEAVVNFPIGVAYSHRILNENQRMAGKTGTSQVISKRYANDDLSKLNVAWFNRNHGLFAGYAPIEQPKYACAVLVEHGGGGARAAAPVVKDILLAVQNLYDIGKIT